MNHTNVITQDDSSQHNENTKDDISISSLVLSGVEGVEALRHRQGNVILKSIDSITNEQEQTRTDTTIIHHDNPPTVESDPPPQPLPPHTIIPTATLQSVVNQNLALCSLCKKGKQCLVTCSTSYFATTLRVECVSCEKEKRIIRENIRRLKTKEATQGDKIKQKYQAIKNIWNQIQRREKHL